MTSSLASLCPPYEYKYCKLDDATNEIRIINIKTVTDEFIEVELQKQSLQPDVQYNALSWCWRTQDEKQQTPEFIYIWYEGKKFRKELSTNLTAGIRALYNLSVNTIWIDWLCIDQENNDERSNQVQLMSRIYGEAQCVYIWLGLAGNESDLAFAFIPKLLDTEEYDEIAIMEVPDVDKQISALKALMMRDWFSRRWIIQEIALAETAKLLCGKMWLDWSDFADAISLWVISESETNAASKLMMSRSDTRHDPNYLGSISALGAARLVEVTNNLFLPGEGKNHSRPRLQSLEYLVSIFTPFNATEARDAIYAILAIAKDTTPSTEQQLETFAIQEKGQGLATRAAGNASVTSDQIAEKSPKLVEILKEFISSLETRATAKSYNVDYSLPISDVYADFVRFCIERAKDSDPTRALDILCRPWAPDPDYDDTKEGDEAPGHWRAKFTKRKALDGSNSDQLQSARPDAWLLNEDYLSCNLADRQAAIDRADRKDKKRKDKGRTEVKKCVQSMISKSPICDTLPSWTPSVRRVPFARTGGARNPKMTRINADPLVGDPSESQRSYNASGTKGVTTALRFEQGVVEEPTDKDVHLTHYQSIHVEGFVLGSIEKISERSQGGQIPSQWSKLINRNKSDDIQQTFWDRKAADEFWRTLVADRGSKTVNPPRCFRRILQDRYTGRDDLNLKEVIDRGSPVAKEVALRVQAVIWSRKLMRIRKRKGSEESRNWHEQNIGLAGQEAKKDDLVCILYGCSVPVVLRRYEKSRAVMEGEIRQKNGMDFMARLHTWRKRKLYRRELEEERLLHFQNLDRQKPVSGRGTQNAGSVQQLNASESSKRSLDHDMESDQLHRPKRQRMVTPATDDPPPTASPNAQKSSAGSSQSATDPPISDASVYYKLIGECYIHRMMNGEAINYQTTEKLPRVCFEIR